MGFVMWTLQIQHMYTGDVTGPNDPSANESI